MEKPIPGFPGYTITDDGKVISYKMHKPKIMKTWYQHSGYENIKLCKNNITYHFLIHRLVAEAFIPNPTGLKEINHKNNNKQDNRVENLEWCDRRYNLQQSYETMSPVRNFRKCILCDNNNPQFRREFQSIRAAARYVQQQFGYSALSLIKYYRVGPFEIKFETCND